MLTNHCVTKKLKDNNEGEYAENGFMWSSDEFAEYLEDNHGPNTWREKIWPQIKKYVKCSLQSVQENIDNRKNSFEFFGYDFMIDADLRLWLLEVNASPSMATDTPITADLVTRVLTDLPKVVIDLPNAPNRNRCDTGGFVCIFCSNIEVTRP